ncbi:MAG TPA: membrane-bound lytic murein transglycosylase MltF [Steroidobacteraceae bacterium]|nr:membrane-bound lytic murein transglycosylase MltF [Steroidobacteraceae bacterium]
MLPQPVQAAERRRDIRSRFGVPGIVVLSLMIGTCSRMPGSFEQVRLEGVLKVVTRNSPLAYYEGAAGPEGPEYELARGFARRLGVRLELRFADTGAAALEEIRHNRVQLAAAGIIATPARRGEFLFGPVYQQIDQHVVYRVQDPLPRSPQELIGRRVLVIRGSTHAAALARLAAEWPGLAYTEVDDRDPMDLLEAVAAGEADVTVADSTEFSLARHFHPDLRPAFKLAESESIAWALAPQGADLLQEVERYFRELEAIGLLEQIRERHRRSLVRYDRVDAANFVASVRERLPQYRAWFEQAAADTGIDWRLLAAVGYQESRWDANAVSPTGVRGLMMLTAETARRVGVRDRAEAQDSIAGGARYLRLIRDTIPARIGEPDRTWLALAAYNVGYGHLEDARVLAQRRGRNPDAWEDVRETLPLLAQERWYRQTRRGYARGWEPVGFVRNVQTYAELLNWLVAGEPDSAARGEEAP